MHSRRIAIWSASILMAAVLMGCLLLALLFPWDRFENNLKESLNGRLDPLRVDFEGLRFFLKGGPGLSVEGLRLFAADPQAGRDPLLTCSRLTLRPYLKDLTRRELAAHFVLETPSVRVGRSKGDRGSAGGMIGLLARGIDPEGRSLAERIPLPAGFALTAASLLVQDGSLNVEPSSGMSGIRASLRVESDLSFDLELEGGTLIWNREENGPLNLSGTVSAEIRGRTVSPGKARTKGTVRLGSAVIEWQDRTATLLQPLQVSFDVEEGDDGVLSVSAFRLTGPGVEIGAKGPSSLSENLSRIDIRDLIVKVENWHPVCSLLLPEAELSGRLSLVAARIGIDPSRGTLPVWPSGSFLPTLPEGLSFEGLRLHFSEGRLPRTDFLGYCTSLKGVELRLDQQDHGWAGTLEMAEWDAARGRGFRFSGQAAIKAEWTEDPSGAKALLVVDLSRGRLSWGNLLDKPPDRPLQLGVRTRILGDEIRVGSAFLEMGETKWTFKGSIRNPAEPFLDATFASDIVALDTLAEMFPAARKHELGGRVEIKELAITARLGSFRESALIHARLASKDLEVHGTSVRGLYAQAVYGNQLLTVHPLLIQPARGMIEAEVSADFSRSFLEQGRHQYYGTLRIDHVDIDDLAGLAAPSLQGKATGSADVNLAFRGSGFSWPEAAPNLEAKARIYLNHLALEGEEASAGNPAEGLAGQMDRAVQELEAQETPTRKDGRIDPKQQRLLTQNRAAGWFTMQEGSIRTENLVAIYDGKLVEIRGSLDVSGHLKVERGSLFTGGRMLPFQIDCRLGEEPCKPRPDLKEMGKSAAAELAEGIRLLSEGARDVFKDLLF